MFRGNEPEGLGKLEQLIADDTIDVVDVPMTECQRCPAPIVNAANQLMSLYSAAPMVPVSTRLPNTHVVVWNTPHKEAAGMAKAILANYRAHPNDSHLVMVTRRRFGYWLRDSLGALDANLTIDLSFSESLLETWPVREAFLFFSLMVDPDAPTWRAWFGYSNSVTGTTFKTPKRNAGSYLEFLAACGDKITWEFVEALAAEQRSVRRGAGGTILWDRAKRLLALRDVIGRPGSDAGEWITSVFEPSDWVSNQTEDSEISLVDLQLACDKAHDILETHKVEVSTAEAPDQLRHVARILRYQIATREPFAPSCPANIQVATLWGAKGVTADHVYVLGLCREALPGTRRDEYPGTDLEYVEEQRRLFYVSLTRAKTTLVLSRAVKIKRNEAKGVGIAVSTNGGQYPPLEVSPFLRDILAYLPNGVDGDRWAGAA